MTDTNQIARRIALLKPEQQSVLAAMSKGLNGPEIAKEMHYKRNPIVNAMITRIYKKLGIGQEVRSYKEKRRLVTEAFILFQEQTTPTSSKPNGKHEIAPTQSQADAGKCVETSLPGLVGYGVANTIELTDPLLSRFAPVTIGRKSDTEIDKLLHQGYVAKYYVEYQSLTDEKTFVSRVIMVKRRR